MAKDHIPQAQPETSSESETESDSEESEDQKTLARTPPTPQAPAKPASSESGSDSSESSEDDAPLQVVDVVQKPSSVKKSVTAQAVTTPSKLTGTKRVADTSREKVTKKGKKEDTLIQKDNVSDAKKSPFQRIFSYDDEIVLLRGILDFMKETGRDPCVDINSFHDFIRKKIHVTVNKEQLKGKIRSLKRKYTKNQVKEVDGKDLVFSKPNEDLTYQLSKQIWRKDNAGVAIASTSKVPSKPKGNKEKKLAEHINAIEPIKVSNAGYETLHRLPNFEATEWLREAVKVGSEMLEGGKGSMAWENIKRREMDLYLELMQLSVDKAKLAFDAIKSDKSQ